jgi:ELWxxDGT repeat protein
MRLPGLPLPALLSTLSALAAVGCGGLPPEEPDAQGLETGTAALSAEGPVLHEDAQHWELCGPSPRLVMNIAPGAPSANPETLSGGSGLLFFAADDGLTGREPWVSGGSSTSTRRLRDLAPGVAGSDPAHFTRLGSSVFFTASNGLDGHELWRSDGTARGTVRLGDLQPGAAGSEPEHLTVFKGLLYFTADDGMRGRELWRSDGTADGTFLLHDFTPGWDFRSTDFELSATRGFLYIRVSVYSPTEFEGNRTQLWRTDGTASGLVRLFDAPGHVTLSGLTPLGDRLFFLAGAQEGRTGLYLTDGTTWGTRLLREFPQAPRALTVFDGKLFFAGGTQVSAQGDFDEELWRSDGTRTGTLRVKDLAFGLVGSDIAELAVVGNTLFFTADDGEHGRELWLSDGTAAGTRLSDDLEPGPAGSFPRELASIDGHLFFSASTASAGREAWVKGGGLGGAMPLGDGAPGAASSEPRGFIRSGWDIYFSADDQGPAGRELRAVRFRPQGLCD